MAKKQTDKKSYDVVHSSSSSQKPFLILYYSLFEQKRDIRNLGLLSVCFVQFHNACIIIVICIQSEYRQQCICKAATARERSSLMRINSCFEWIEEVWLSMQKSIPKSDDN